MEVLMSGGEFTGPRFRGRTVAIVFGMSILSAASFWRGWVVVGALCAMLPICILGAWV
jgi:hypothetical protein